ncbi:MAG: hypothetical protein ACI4GW_07550 [Lachnospiraceae bacterium]
MEKILKKIIYIFYAVLIVVIVLLFIISIEAKKSRLEQEKKQAQEERLELYSDAVNISGDFVVDGDKVTINNKEYAEIKMIAEVSLYNEFYKEDKVTIDELMTEFDTFCDCMDESALFEKYQERMRTITVRCENVGIFIREYDYSRHAYYYLEKVYGEPLDFDNITTEDWVKAYEVAAEKIYNEVLELEERN